LCLNLGGDWINAGGGTGGMINPLEIRPVPKDEHDEENPLYIDEGNGMNDLALHMKTLEIFFDLYLPSLSDMQKALLKQTLEELYARFGIHWDTDIRQLSSSDYPIFRHLYDLVEEKYDVSGKEDFQVLASLLRDIAIGADQFLWNGQTTLNAQSRFICLDTLDLQNMGEKIKKTQYFNILTWSWEQMSRNRKERVLQFCDEAYTMIDPQVPQSLQFLRNAAKRVRKYEAAIGIISHSVVDFLDPSIKMYGQALLDTPCYKIIMGCDGKNLQETKDLYSLTEAEQELLLSKRRGEGLFMIGSKRLRINFDIPEYRFKYMGNAGGR